MNTLDDLIDNFLSQQIKIKLEIDQLKEKLSEKEEYLIKLVGGVEALTLYKDQENLSVEEGG